MSGLDLLSRRAVSTLVFCALLVVVPKGFNEIRASQVPERDGHLPLSLDLGEARRFNGFFRESFVAPSSDTEGRLGAGTDISVNHYSIADKLQATIPGITLLAGGDLVFPNGRVYQGDILTGGSAAGLGEAVINGLSPDQSVFEFAELPFDFEAEFERLEQISQSLAELPANGTFEWQWGGLYLEGDCESLSQVFELDGQQVLDAHTFQVSCIPDGATVIFNIDGTDTGLTNMSLASLIPHRNQVLFNFHQAERLTLAGIGIEGSVLAPGAHVDQPQGVIDGTIMARSWDGPMQLNHRPFKGVGAGDFCALYPIAVPFDLLTAAEPGTEFHQIPRGTGPGNYSWLTWAGSPSAPVLANSLIPPGNSYTYVNPDDDSDWLLSIDDWVQGAPGVMNSNAIRTNLDALLGVEISVPAWSDIRGEGNNLDYQVAKFARIRLLDYRLPGNGWLSFEFLGFTHCYNRAPEVHDQWLETEMNEALDIELTGEDMDGDAITFEIIRSPEHGTLAGAPPLIQYIPDAGFIGTDYFEFIGRDTYLASEPATVTIDVIRSNLPPKIISTPPLTVGASQTYQYLVEALDPDDDVLAYSLDHSQPGTVIDEIDGWMRWSPAEEFIQSVRSENTQCRLPVDPTFEFQVDPILKWRWSAARVLSIPLVGPFFDTNGDGLFDDSDVPTVAIFSHTGFVDGASSTLRFLDGATGSEISSVPGLSVRASAHAAWGDLTGDGRPEIVVWLRNGNIAAVTPDGEILWQNDQVANPAGYNYSAINLADIDGDGRPEILARQNVLNADGEVLWIAQESFWHRTTSFAADLTGDGDLEVIVGGSVYDRHGNQLWNIGQQAGSALAAVADFNGDSLPELVFVHGGSVSLYSHDGQMLWEGATIPGGGGGAPTVGDFTGNGRPEVGVAGRSRYVVFDANGSILWDRTVQDFSSRTTGSTLFDFNGNGLAEVIYADERFLRVYEGATGEILYEVPNCSATASEYPVVADIDGNGNAQILVVSDCGSTVGIRAFEDVSGRWMPTRPIWNQYDYHIGNINDDGTIPSDQPKSWLTHNTFRLNAFSDRHPQGLPDLALFDLRLTVPDGDAIELLAVNRGLAPVELDVVARLYNGPRSAAGELIGEIDVSPLGSSESRILRLEGVNLDAITSLYAYIDPDNIVQECNTENNHTSAAVFQVRATDPGELFDTQRFTANVENVNRPPEVQSQAIPPAAINHGYTFSVSATDPDRGDALSYSIDEGPEGLRINEISGQLVWVPSASQVGEFEFVVRATDLGGLSTVRELQIEVLNREPPEFISEPVVEGIVGGLYRYDALAIDAEGGQLSYALMASPFGMEIDTHTGSIVWVPEAVQVGQHEIVVRAINDQNLWSLQEYEVTITDSNRPPEITSEPSTLAIAGQSYSYQIIASDPDGDSLEYSLALYPDGMSVDSGSGLIEWLPAELQVGQHIVEVEVSDGFGGFSYQAYVITVELHGDTNQPPAIFSEPHLAANLGQIWNYQVEATDPDGDPLVFELLQGPDGSAMNAAGLIDWTPDASQLGEHALVVEVRDDRGGWARQSFSVYVYDGASNQPPEILSTPAQQATVGLSYSYQVEAVDPDGDVLEFFMQTGPAGAVIDPVSGLLQWTPLTSQIGLQDFDLLVLDGNNGTAWQRFNVLVEAPPVGNRPPVFLSTPPQTAKTGREYRYAIVAKDPDGDALDYRLLESPADMSLSVQDAELSWSPTSEGSYPVEIEISDGEFAVTQSWNLEVLDGSVPLGLDLEITPTVADIGQTVSIRLLPQAVAGDVIAEVLVNGTPVAVDPDLVARFETSVAGEHLVVAAIDDGFEQADATDSFFVRDPDAEGGPIVSLSSPDYEAEITEPTMVVGTVQDDNLAGWTLAWAEAGTQNWTILAEGSEPINEAEIAVFDPTLLINGQYRIALQAWDNQGRSSFDSREVQVTGDMKLGHFAITFEDATVPLAGIPITLTRTYDTRQRHKDLDFGFGWSVGYQDVRLHESRRVGLGWSLNEYRQGLFSTWCVEPNGDPIVTVRLPDDEVHRFRAKASPECQQLVPFIDVNIVFEALDGTNSTLTQSDFGLVRIVNGNIVDLGEPDQPIDPDRYRLTLEDGTVLSVDQHFGLRQLQDTNDNTLTFTRDGVTHSSGVGIDFVRDGDDRISQVLLPDGEILDYVYDASGNLTAFADQAENVTQYTYLAGAAHYLEDIIDPRGVRAIRNEYDEDGRLVAQIDADGNRLEFDRNIAGRVETIRDRRGHATVYIYDDRGNVLSETNALGETTLRSYDEFGNELTRTDPLGHTWQMAYDSRGNQTAETNPLGETNNYAYNSRGLITSHTAPDGTVVMANQYNERTGNLTASTDALGQATTFSYDLTGNLTRTTDALSQETRNFYDSRGNLIREIDPRGVETHYTHDVMGRVLTETVSWTDGDGNPQALVTSHDYDANGNRIRTTDPLGAVREFEYDAASQMIAEIDPLGRRTEYEFDSRGNQVLVRHPDGSTQTSAYDPEGNLIAETDRAGRTTRMVYDAGGRPIETIFPDDTPADDSDNPRRFSIFDAAGRLVEEVDERGNSTFYEYDDAGRNTRVIDALGNETVYEYDLRGQRTAVIDARGHRTESVYDAAGRLVRTIHPDATESSVSYDALGQKIAETDPAGRTTRFEYDQTGNLTAVIDALDQRTEYAYDERGNRIAQTDANGQTTTWTFDATGRMLSRTLPLGQTESYQYDVAGQRTARTDFNGQTTLFAYDLLSRPTRTEHPDGSVVETRYTTSGQVWEIEVTCSPAPCVAEGRELGVTVHQYDVRDRLTRIQYPDGRWIEYSYDQAGNRTEVLTENQRTRYTFDALKRMVTVTACPDEPCSQGEVTTYHYNEVGSRSRVDHANASYTEYHYDTRNRLTTLFTAVPGQVLPELVHHQVFTLGAAGHRQMLVEDDDRVVQYSYDALYRLTEEQVTDPRGNRTTTFSYDAVGNRLSRTVTCDPECHGEVEAGVTTYIYDANDRLLEEMGPDGVTTYQYDQNGNTLQKSAPDGTVVYTYNAEDRLTQASGALESGIATEYSYDAQGIRHRQTVDGITSRFLVDPTHQYAQVLETLDATANPVATYVIGHERISQTQAGQTHTYHADGLGSIRVLTDDTGTAIDSYVFEAFGQLEHATGTTPNSFRYTGEQYDPNLGFYYLRARYYNPANGRFPTMDTYQGRIHEPQTLHKYLYVHGDSVNNIDPSGLFQISTFGMAFNLMGSSIGRSVLVGVARPFLVKVAKAAAFAGVGTAAYIVGRRLREDRKRPPTFLVGSNHPDVRNHILNAQLSKGIRPIVHRRGVPHDRDWLSTRLTSGTCGDGLSGGSTGKDCDEFPMAIHIEGGKQNFLRGAVSIRPVSSTQNRSVGGMMPHFHRACKIVPDDSGFDGAYVMGVTDVPTHWICGANR